MAGEVVDPAVAVDLHVAVVGVGVLIRTSLAVPACNTGEGDVGTGQEAEGCECLTVDGVVRVDLGAEAGMQAAGFTELPAVDQLAGGVLGRDQIGVVPPVLGGPGICLHFERRDFLVVVEGREVGVELEGVRLELRDGEIIGVLALRRHRRRGRGGVAVDDGRHGAIAVHDLVAASAAGQDRQEGDQDGQGQEGATHRDHLSFL